MYRTHNCGELRKSDINSKVKLSGWVQRIRNKGFLIWIDLRDRYGITQLFINSENVSDDVIKTTKLLGREFVISIDGKGKSSASSNPQYLNASSFSSNIRTIVLPLSSIE